MNNIFGIGLDLEEIERIEKICSNTTFLLRFFSEDERKLFEKKGKNKIQSIAANYAAKEAFSKAIGTGFSGIKLSDIEILRYDSGKPYIHLSGVLADMPYTFEVSLTHTKTTAAAVVVAIAIK